MSVAASSLSDNRDGPFTDDALVAGLTDRQTWALRALIESCGPYVYKRATQIVRDAHLAEEIAQDTLLVLWWDPQRFDPAKGSLKSFLMGVTRNKAIDRIRHEEVVRSAESTLTESTEFFNIASADHRIEQSMVVGAALSKLPAAKREALFLAYYRGFTFKQVAQVMKIPEGTAKSRIRDSLVTLRALLQA